MNDDKRKTDIYKVINHVSTEINAMASDSREIINYLSNDFINGKPMLNIVELKVRLKTLRDLQIAIIEHTDELLKNIEKEDRRKGNERTDRKGNI